MRGLRPTILTLCIVAGLVSSAFAQRPTEYEVKAAFVYNFAKFTEWAPGAFAGDDAPIVIGVLGEDPFGAALGRTVRGKTVKGRRLAVRRFSKAGDGLRTCHILFVSASESGRLASVFKHLQGEPVLTVGEIEGFGEKGGMINFVLDQHRIRFEINPEVAERAGLKLSSRLLKLARIVRREPPEGGK